MNQAAREVIGAMIAAKKARVTAAKHIPMVAGHIGSIAAVLNKREEYFLLAEIQAMKALLS